MKTNNSPLSIRLNQFILNWYEDKKEIFNFVEVDDFNENDIEGTFKKHLEKFENTGKIDIWTGCSENTIFGDEKINKEQKQVLEKSRKAIALCQRQTKQMGVISPELIAICEELNRKIPKEDL